MPSPASLLLFLFFKRPRANLDDKTALKQTLSDCARQHRHKTELHLHVNTSDAYSPAPSAADDNSPMQAAIYDRQVPAATSQHLRAIVHSSNAIFQTWGSEELQIDLICENRSILMSFIGQ
jgi:hypothetical protein